MDLNSAQSHVTTLAENAGKSALRAMWTWTAVHPRSSVLIASGVAVASFFAGLAVGGSF